TTEQQKAADSFLAAIRHGDLQGLLDVLAPDVVAIADGDGLAPASRRPIQGAERVAHLLIDGFRSVDFEAKVVWLNGSTGIRIDVDDQFTGAVNFAVENSRITRIYAISNPHKLARIDRMAAITRS